MSLKGEIELYKDYVIVAPQIWLKLHEQYGGAPDIMLQIINKPVGKLEAPDMPEQQVGENGQEEPFILSQKFTEVPDLNPLRIFAFYEEAVQNRQGL